MRKRSRFYLDEEDEDRVTYDEFTNPADAVLKPDVVEGEDEFLDQEDFGFSRSRLQSQRPGRRSIPDLPPSLYDLNAYEPQQKTSKGTAAWRSFRTRRSDASSAAASSSSSSSSRAKDSLLSLSNFASELSSAQQLPSQSSLLAGVAGLQALAAGAGTRDSTALLSDASQSSSSVSLPTSFQRLQNLNTTAHANSHDRNYNRYDEYGGGGSGGAGGGFDPASASSFRDDREQGREGEGRTQDQWGAGRRGSTAGVRSSSYSTSASGLDLPSHWGGGAGAGGGASKAAAAGKLRARASLPLPSKPSKSSHNTQKASRYSLGENLTGGGLNNTSSKGAKMSTGSIMHFPPVKVQLKDVQEGKKQIAAVSFRPSWIGGGAGGGKSNNRGSSESKRSRDEVEEIHDDGHDGDDRDIEGFDQSGYDDGTVSPIGNRNPRNSFGGNSGTQSRMNNFSEDRAHRSGASAGAGAGAGFDNDSSFGYYEDRYTQPGHAGGWVSPPSSSRRGKGHRRTAPAGSMRGIFQKIQRNVQEKETRIMNIKSSSRARDPMDPRNRAASRIDVVVVKDEGEQWPFRVAVVCVVDSEMKLRKPLTTLQNKNTNASAGMMHYDVQGNSERDGERDGEGEGEGNALVPEEEPHRTGLDDDFQRESENQSIAAGAAAGAGVGAGAGAGTSAGAAADPSGDVNSGIGGVETAQGAPVSINDTARPHAAVIRREKVDHLEELRAPLLSLETLSRGTFLRAYFKADPFKGSAGKVFGRGCVLRVYEPELLSSSLSSSLNALQSVNNKTEDGGVQKRLIAQLSSPDAAISLDLIFRTFQEMTPALDQPVPASSAPQQPAAGATFPGLVCTQLFEPLDIQF